MGSQKKTGELLIQQGLITEEQLYKAMLTQKALSAQRGISKPIGEVLIDLEIVPEEKVLAVVSSQVGVPFIDIDQYDIPPEILSSIPEKLARAKKVIPVSKIEGALTVGMADPSDLATVDEIEFLCGCEVITVLASRKGILRAIDRSYPMLKKAKTKSSKKKKGKGPGKYDKLPGEEKTEQEENAPPAPFEGISDADLGFSSQEDQEAPSEDVMNFFSGFYPEETDEAPEAQKEFRSQEENPPEDKPEEQDTGEFFEEFESDEWSENVDDENYKDELADIWEEVARTDISQSQADTINVGSVVVEDVDEEKSQNGSGLESEEITTSIIKKAITKEASMVYFEYLSDEVRVRYRIGNSVEHGDSLDSEYGRALLVHFKRLAGLKIHENEHPQSGRTPVAIGNKRIMLSVSSLPTILGETLAVRILEEKPWLTLEKLGFTKRVLAQLRKALESRRGTILVTGPPRSGKTTTMYSILREYDADNLKIIDIESNFEVHIPSVNQVQINLQKGIASSDALSAAIEHQPDIVLLEELNDYLGSEIALRLGLGSLLITSVITQNALSAITKLQDMTLDPFLVSTSISAVLNQRVVRKICPKCRVKYKPSQALQDKIKSIAKIKEVVFYKGKGCDNCNQTGFVGEIGIFELVIFNEAIKSAIVAGVPQAELKKQIEKNRLRSIWQDGMEKVLRGITTFEEITRVL